MLRTTLLATALASTIPVSGGAFFTFFLHHQETTTSATTAQLISNCIAAKTGDPDPDSRALAERAISDMIASNLSRGIPLSAQISTVKYSLALRGIPCPTLNP